MGGYQATVRVDCVDGQEFAGEVLPNSKDAEKSAAQQAFSVYQNHLATLPESAKGKKRKSDEIGPVVSAPVRRIVKALKVGRLEEEAVVNYQYVEEPAAVTSSRALVPVMDPTSPLVAVLTPKSELNSTCAKIIRRAMQKNDILYETTAVQGGFQSMVTMVCLPNRWSAQAFAGEVTSKKSEAEQSAAAIAMASIRADPELMSKLVAPPKAKAPWNGSKGGGSYYQKGKGKGGYGKSPQMRVPDGSEWGAPGGSDMLAATAAWGFNNMMMGGFGLSGFSNM